MATSPYLGNAILDHILRGVSLETIDKIWVSLHTGSSGTGAGTEVKTTQWPSYMRIDANVGAQGIDGAFNPATNMACTNAKQLLWPPFDGTGSITINGIALWTASTGGQQLFYGILSADKTLSPSDEIVVHVDGLKIQVA